MRLVVLSLLWAVTIILLRGFVVAHPKFLFLVAGQLQIPWSLMLHTRHSHLGLPWFGCLSPLSRHRLDFDIFELSLCAKNLLGCAEQVQTCSERGYPQRHHLLPVQWEGIYEGKGASHPLAGAIG